MCVSSCIDELRVDPHSIAHPAHHPFENMSDAERPADLAQIAIAPAELPHRCPTDDFQIGDLRQAGKDVVLDAVG